MAHIRFLSIPCLLIIALAASVAGCAGPGGGRRADPWSKPVAAPAQNPPRTLSGADGVSVETDMSVVDGFKPELATPSYVESYDQTQSAGYPAPAALPSVPVKVGLLVPLSGSKAAIGRAMLNAAQMAVFDSGLETFEILPRDTGDSPEKARAAAQDAAISGAQILIGPLTAPAARAVAPVAQARGISTISFSTDWTVASAGPLVMGFMPFGQVRRMAEWAAENGLRRVAVLAPDNEYGNASLKTFQTRGRDVGLSLLSVVKVPPNAETFDREVEALLAQIGQGGGLDAVFLPMPGDKAAKLSARLSAAGLTPDRVRRMGTGLWDDESLASLSELSGAVFAAPPPSLRADFETRYMRTYGGAPPRLSTLAYDATALAAVLARGGLARTGHPAFGRAEIMNPNGFAGLDGIFRFRSDGLAERGVAVLTFSRGGIREDLPAPQTFQASDRLGQM